MGGRHCLRNNAALPFSLKGGFSFTICRGRAGSRGGGERGFSLLLTSLLDQRSRTQGGNFQAQPLPLPPAAMTFPLSKFPKSYCLFREQSFGGTWVAQSVRCLTLGIGSGQDLMVREWFLSSSPADRAEPAWDSPSLSLSAPSLLAHSLSQNK